MTIDESRLHYTLQNHPNTKAPVKTAPAVVASIASSLDASKALLQNETIETGIQFALWSDLWNKYGTYGTQRKTTRLSAYPPGTKITKGTVLEVDFGHYNIAPEFSYGHYGVVIADHYDIVIVAPITSDRRHLGKQTHLLHYKTAVIEISAKNYPIFDHDSLVLVHQTRSVSKNRIYGQLGSIKGTQLMEDIEYQYFERYSTTTGQNLNAKIKTLEKSLAQKEIDLKKKQAQINALQEQLNALTGTPKMVAPGHESNT